MLINDYVEFRFGSKFSSKYNKLVFEEIKSDPERYVFIGEYLDEINEGLKNKNYSLTGAIDDDPQFEMQFEHAHELNCAFLRAYAKANKKIKIHSVSISHRYFGSRSIVFAFDQYNNYLQAEDSYICNGKSITKSYFVLNKNGLYKKTSDEKVFGNFEPLLCKIANSLLNSFDDCLFNSIKNEEMFELTTPFGKKLFGLVEYRFVIENESGEKSVATFYTTEEGYTPFHWMFQDTELAFKNAIK